MSDAIAAITAYRVSVFFYGSFIRREIMAKGGLIPESIIVARLSGFDIHIDPHASLSRSDQHSIYGVLVKATHHELSQLYSMNGVEVFLPEAVIVETPQGIYQPALCYLRPVRDDKPADLEYLRQLLIAAREYAFPAWYIARLESFR